ncbi:MAG: FISUMP domain-containing protein [Patescibacteria group bacterium]
MPNKQPSVYGILSIVFILISLACIVAIVRIRSVADTSLSPTQTAQVGNTAPSVDEVIPSDTSGSGDLSLPSAGLMLNEGSTVDLYVRGTVSDPNGCANLDHIDIKAYRSGVTEGAACTPDGNDCYSATFAHGDIVCSGTDDVDAVFEVVIPVKYFADPTDVGSQYEEETWKAEATAYDASGNAGSLANDFETQSLAAFGLSVVAIDYGSLSLGATSLQQDIIFSNTGNRLVNAYVNADHDFRSNLTGFSDILSTAVHYSLANNFTYGAGDTAVELTQTLMELNLTQQTDDAVTTTVPGYLLLKLPTSGINGTYSNTLFFTAFAPPFLGPTPQIASLSTSSTPAGSEGFDLGISGTDFPVGAVVRWNGSDRTTTRVDSSHLTVTILASDLTAGGTASITVFNPSSGNSSSVTTFTLENPVPTLGGISPSTKYVGDAQFGMTLTGTGFTGTSQVNIGGQDVTTSFVSVTQVTAVVPAALMSTSGTFDVTVTNPAPGGGSSAVGNFVVTNPVPVLGSISPNSKSIGSAQFTLTLTGSGFVSTSQVIFNGSARATTYADSGHLTVTILASDLASAGTLPVAVVNPEPGGGTSGYLNLAVLNTTKAITGFTVPSQIGGTTINEGAHTVAFTMAYGTDVTNLLPTITHTGASVSPVNGAAHDFTSPSTYTVTAQDGSTQAYTVTVTIAKYTCTSNSISYGGQTYPTVSVGGQCWLKKNLNIGTQTTGAQANNGYVEKRCYADNSTNCTSYGGLYQPNEAMGYSVTPGVQGICPPDFHVPTDAEWATMESYLGSSWFSKMAATSGDSPPWTGLNTSGFLATPGGGYTDSSYTKLGSYAQYLTSTMNSTNYYTRFLETGIATLSRTLVPSTYARSLRCIMNSGTYQ